MSFCQFPLSFLLFSSLSNSLFNDTIWCRFSSFIFRKEGPLILKIQSLSSEVFRRWYLLGIRALVFWAHLLFLGCIFQVLSFSLTRSFRALGLLPVASLFARLYDKEKMKALALYFFCYRQPAQRARAQRAQRRAKE
jgi:hypothetical protein